MNDEVLTSDDQRLLDRLVDDELNETERRDVLLRLERSNDGWRRCALAFLEAQAWRGEVTALVAEPASSSPVMPATVAGRGWKGSVVGVPLAAAAGFLVAFLAGRAVMPPQADLPPQQIAVGVLNDGQPRVGANENVRLVVNSPSGGKQNVVDVPLVDRSRMNEALFGNWSSQNLPPEMKRMLEQPGSQVVRQRQLVPVDLRDGRRVVVPVDQVEIRPVTLQQFQ